MQDAFTEAATIISLSLEKKIKAMRKFDFKINEHSYLVSILGIDNNTATVDVNGILYEVEVEQDLKRNKMPSSRKDFVPSLNALSSGKSYSEMGSSGIIRAPMPGKIFDLPVKVGDRVSIGQTVICIEAMKMENNIRTDRNGIVKSINVQTNDVVTEGAFLLEVE